MTRLQVEQSAIRELYAEQGKTGKKLMHQIFGEDAFKERPIGIWCLSADGDYVEANKWNKDIEAVGCLVVTEDTAFIVALHANTALQWGAMDKAKSGLIQDQKTYDCKAATDAMLKAYEGAIYESNSDKIWKVEGAPAAQWCRQYSRGNIHAGGWDLPTVAQLKIIYTYRNEINDCLMAMGGFKLTPGWYWSSIEHPSDDTCAWAVSMYYGDVDWYSKPNLKYVRAVSAFQL